MEISHEELLITVSQMAEKLLLLESDVRRLKDQVAGFQATERRRWEEMSRGLGRLPR